jgi:hypothetical protein
MLQLYLPQEPELRQPTPTGICPDDVPFIVAANIFAGRLLDIAGPFFWAALIVMFFAAALGPR